MIAIRSGQFCPHEVRSKLWVGCDSIEEAVRLAASSLRSFESDADGFEVVGEGAQPNDHMPFRDPENLERVVIALYKT